MDLPVITQSTLDQLVSDRIRVMTHMAAYTALVIALMWDAIAARGHDVLPKILKTAILVAAIAYYDTILVQGCSMFDIGCSAARKEVMDTLKVIQSANFKPSGLVEGIGGWFTFQVIRLFCAITGFVQWISINVFRVFFLACLSVTAPIVIGLGSIRIFESLLARFAGYTMAVIMWSIGFAIVDKVLAAICSNLSHLIASSGALNELGVTTEQVTGIAALGIGASVGSQAWIPFLIVSMIMAFSACFFYMMVPTVMFAILGGSNPALAMWGAMRSGTQMGIAMAGKVAAGAGKGAGAIVAGATGAGAAAATTVTAAAGTEMPSGTASTRIREKVKNLDNGGVA